MFRLVHVAPLYGIVMNVIQLLTHNHLRFDDLRMIALKEYRKRNASGAVYDDPRVAVAVGRFDEVVALAEA